MIEFLPPHFPAGSSWRTAEPGHCLLPSLHREKRWQTVLLLLTLYFLQREWDDQLMNCTSAVTIKRILTSVNKKVNHCITSWPARRKLGWRLSSRTPSSLGGGRTSHAPPAGPSPLSSSPRSCCSSGTAGQRTWWASPSPSSGLSASTRPRTRDWGSCRCSVEFSCEERRREERAQVCQSPHGLGKSLLGLKCGVWVICGRRVLESSSWLQIISVLVPPKLNRCDVTRGRCIQGPIQGQGIVHHSYMSHVLQICGSPDIDSSELT